ncbi:MAG: DMT family transporter [Planctomycetota bacterium]|jgi:drug/metabolite transporter (DMT)-like permease
MQDHLLGASFALAAALVWAFAVILFKRCGEKISPLSLNLFKNCVALVLLAVTLLVIGESFGTLSDFSAEDIWILVLSGFLGITLADTLFFYSLNLVGVSIVSIVDTLYSPFILLFSWMLLSEQLTALQYLGAGLIIMAVLITTRMDPPKDRTRGQLLAGIVIGVVNMALMGLGIVIAKPVLEYFPIIWATTIRLAAGSAALFIIVLALPQRKALLAAFRPSKDWKMAVPGSILGAYLACILWIGGFKYTYASVASVLNQTSTVLSILLAVIILKETFTRRKFLAMVLAMAGIVLVMMFQG